MPEIQLTQGTVHYRDEGSGPAVVLIHGLLVNGRIWEGVVRRAAGDVRLIVPDLPLGSHPRAMNAGADLSPLGIAALIAELLERLELEDVTLVGNDTGGALCQLVCTHDPERIGRLVLTNCDAFDQCPPFPFGAVFGLLRGPISIRTLFGLMRIPALRNSPLGFGLLLSRPDARLTADWIRPCLKDTRICRDLAALLRQVATADLTDVAARLTRFAKPVTLVWGQGDRVFTPRLGRRLAEVFSNGKLIEVPNARTFVSLDNPDAVIDAIAA
jgi:pimeloyl-ACP methyl ester carboxylesterase